MFILLCILLLYYYYFFIIVVSDTCEVFGVYCNKLFLSHMPCSPTVLNGSLSSVQMFTKIKGVLLNIFSSKFNGQTDCNVPFC